MPNNVVELNGRELHTTACYVRVTSNGDPLILQARNDAGTYVDGLTIDPYVPSVTPNVAFLLPSVNDADMNATAGVERQVVYNEADSKVYVCTVTGDPASWSALN